MGTCEKCGGDPVAQQDWENLRNLVEHEDGLINNRLIWMLAFNGFLFTALGLSLGAEATALNKLGDGVGEVTAKGFERSLEILRGSMATAGLLSSLAAFLGVVAALAAIRCAARDFGHLIKAGISRHPGYFSTGPKGAHLLGIASATLIPIIIAGVWSGYLMWLLYGSATGARTTAALVILALCVSAKLLFEGLDKSGARERQTIAATIDKSKETSDV